MIGSAMRKPRIHPGQRLGERRFDDGRAHEGDRHLFAPAGDEAPFPHGLGEGIGVGPAEGERPGGAGVDQFLSYPLLAELLGTSGNQMIAGPAELGAGRLGESDEFGRLARRRLEVAAQTAGCMDFSLPIHIEGESVLRKQLFFGLALMGAHDIGGGHRDEVGRRAALHHCCGHAGRAEKIDLDRLGQWGVERDGGGRVDDHVAACERRTALFAHPKTVLADVAGHGADTTGYFASEPFAEFVAESVEAVVLDDFAGQSGRGVRPTSRPHQNDDLSVWNAAHNAFDQRSAQESGRTGNKKALCPELPADGHFQCLPSAANVVYHLVSEHRRPVHPSQAACRHGAAKGCDTRRRRHLGGLDG